MPELPEVETIVRELRSDLVGKRFKDVWSDREKPLRQAGGVLNLKKEIKKHKILKVWRRAKFIVIDIEGPKSIFIHQKISGHLLYGKWKFKNDKWTSVKKGPLSEDPHNKYIRILFGLSDGHQLALSDLRRFGKVLLVDDKNILDLKEVRDLGPEPLDISFKEFKALFFEGGGRSEQARSGVASEVGRGRAKAKSPPRRKRGRVKQVLMDPFFIVGIGNIYSDEILWDSGIHPLSRVENLKEKDLKKIYTNTKKILKRAINLNGSSNDDYRLPSGEKGRFQNYQKAYHQTGKKCSKKDGGVIHRIKVGGRSAHFCPKHQVLM